jgi:CRISP-associated protein Cas1
MRNQLRTLYLSTAGTTARIEHAAIRVERPDQPAVRVPLREVDSIIAYGHINITTDLIHACAQNGTRITYLTRAGRFVAQFNGPTTGNVYLRRAQYRTQVDTALGITTAAINAKILNSRTLLLDTAKDRAGDAVRLRRICDQLATLASQARYAPDIDIARGYEGQAAAVYLRVLGTLPTNPAFRFTKRTRRPPLDPGNAILSYLYALATTRCVAACETVGLDPQAQSPARRTIRPDYHQPSPDH